MGDGRLGPTLSRVGIGNSMPSWYAPDANPTAVAPERTHWDHGWIDPPKHVADKHGPPPFLWYGSVHVGKVFKPGLAADLSRWRGVSTGD